ncbi:MAG: hypothetical protein HY290_27115 [Planctomycetia bacterium]|nr:hypothetical protein [Planctomycetia bacterium]
MKCVAQQLLSHVGPQILPARRGSTRIARYLSQASYWIYVVYLPFVVLAQIAIARLPIPASLKFLVSAMIAMFLALMTYQVFVRRTWVGDCLNGPARRDVREPAIPLLPRVVIPEIPALTAACAQLATSSISPSPAVLGAVNLRP